MIIKLFAHKFGYLHIKWGNYFRFLSGALLLTTDMYLSPV